MKKNVALTKAYIMKIFPIEQVREADQYTIKHEPIQSIDLMERASSSICDWILHRYTSLDKTIHVFCGLGNNGGDGLAVSRFLLHVGFPVKTYIIRYSERTSSDFETNMARLKLHKKHQIIEQSINSPLPEITEDELIVDAIFGSGLTKPTSGFTAVLIGHINKCKAVTIAVDMPSGLFADQHSDPSTQIINADYTLSFQFPKLAFMFPENDRFVGRWDILDIGLHPDFINHSATKNFFMTSEDVTPLLKKRRKFAHKGTFGHALLIAGGYGKMGAAILTTQAALRSGAGLVHAHVPRWGAPIMQTACPEAMLSIDRYEHYLSEMPNLDTFTAIGIGPGLGTQEQTQKAIKLLIQQSALPMVMDADALNILALNKTWIPFLPKNTILTPHPKEFERLAGPWKNDFERLVKQREMAIKHGLYIVLKGAHTSIAFPDGNVYFNSTGNPGMATGGSGDVLTGIITSLLAQGYTHGMASILGVYLHGLAGDLALEENTQESLIASDIIKNIGRAFRQLSS